MRVLFLTHRIPYPPNKGDKIRSYNILKFLNKHHEVYLGSLVDDQADLRFVAAVESRVQKFVFDIIRPVSRRLWSLRSFLTSSPISVSYFYSKKLQKEIDDLIERFDIEAVFCFSSPMAEYLFCSKHRDGKLNNAVRVMDLIDIDSDKWLQYAERCSAWKRWIYRYEARSLAEYEHLVAKTFDHILVVSEQEKALALKMLTAHNLFVISNGVDLNFFRPDNVSRLPIQGPTLVFTGVMDYWPNIEGVSWFANCVFPKIQASVPGVTFYIVGSKPTTEVQRLGRNEGIIVTGYVEDVRPYLAAADVCVAPLRVARGIQNKVLEAMAMAKPVVTTAQGLEGIKAMPGEEIVLAAGETAFAEAVVDLLRDGRKAAEIGRKGRSCAERYYSWDKNLRILHRILITDKSMTGVTAPMRASDLTD